MAVFLSSLLVFTCSFSSMLLLNCVRTLVADAEIMFIDKGHGTGVINTYTLVYKKISCIKYEVSWAF